MGNHRATITNCIHKVKSIFTTSAPEASKSSATQSHSTMPSIRTTQASSEQKDPGLLVFVDIPDVDNVLCCLSVLQYNPDRHVSIVLTPRPVDFSARSYGDKLDRINVLMGPNIGTRTRILRGMTPFSNPPNWVKEMRAKIAEDGENKDVLEYLEPDKDFSSDVVKADTRIYMELSAYRFASFLRERNVDPTRFTFYWDEDSMTKIKSGVRHAQHVADYTYDFSSEALEDYKEATAYTDPKKRREKLLGLCEDYINAQKDICGGAQIWFPFQTLIDEHTSLMQTGDLPANLPVMIGGPFTEALKWLDAGLPMTTVTAMACYISGNSNIFPNQFNVHCDPQSASDFFKVVQARRIPTLLVPTECVKDPEWKLNQAQLDEIFKGHEQVKKVVENFTLQSKALVNTTLYDWVAAIIARRPHIIPTKKVKPYEEPVQQAGVTFEVPPPFLLKVMPDEESCIEMCWTEPQKPGGAVKDRLHEFLIREMQKDLSSMKLVGTTQGENSVRQVIVIDNS